MGCDIHMVVQVLKDCEWKTVEVKNPNYEKGSMHRWEQNEYGFEGYGDRCYDVFAMLAGVRNGYGFAGTDTGDGFDPISPPRGFPRDGFSLDSEDCHCGVWMGDHSFSWVTLAELESYDWDKTTKKRGFITLEQRRWMLSKGLSAPDDWCGGVFGAGVEHISLQEMDRRIDKEPKGGLVVSDPERTYALIEWNVTYKEAACRFYSEFLPILRELGEPDNVRIVFGFDS